MAISYQECYIHGGEGLFEEALVVAREKYPKPFPEYIYIEAGGLLWKLSSEEVYPDKPYIPPAAKAATRLTAAIPSSEDRVNGSSPKETETAPAKEKPTAAKKVAKKAAKKAVKKVAKKTTKKAAKKVTKKAEKKAE